MAERLFDVEDKARRQLAGNLPVPCDRATCPDCGGATIKGSVGEQALFIHGGYGATRTSIVRYCLSPRCLWSLTESVTETNPRIRTHA